MLGNLAEPPDGAALESETSNPSRADEREIEGEDLLAQARIIAAEGVRRTSKSSPPDFLPSDGRRAEGEEAGGGEAGGGVPLPNEGPCSPLQNPFLSPPLHDVAAHAGGADSPKFAAAFEYRPRVNGEGMAAIHHARRREDDVGGGGGDPAGELPLAVYATRDLAPSSLVADYGGYAYALPPDGGDPRFFQDVHREFAVPCNVLVGDAGDAFSVDIVLDPGEPYLGRGGFLDSKVSSPKDALLTYRAQLPSCMRAQRTMQGDYCRCLASGRSEIKFGSSVDRSVFLLVVCAHSVPFRGVTEDA